MNKIALDTDEVQICQHCHQAITGELVIYGVGGSQYLRVFHAECSVRENELPALLPPEDWPIGADVHGNVG